MVRFFVTIRLREQEILRLAMKPDQRRAVWQVIHGTGGMGKTAFALEYARRNARHYDTILFCRAHSKAALASGFSSFARQLKLPQPHGLSNVRAVRNWLNENSGYLLILDHADLMTGFTATDLKAFLPESPRGHILFTSGTNNLLSLLGIKGNRDYHLYKLGEKDAYDLLIEKAGKPGGTLSPDEYAAAMGLANDLDYFPSALELAGAYIRKRKTFTAYLDLLRSRTSDSPSADVPSVFATVWRMNLEAVRLESSASIKLLDIAAFLAPDDLSFDLLSQAEPELFHGITGFEEKTAYWNTLLMPLAEYGLVTPNRSADTFSVSSLGQAMLQNHIAPSDWQNRISDLLSTGWLSERHQKEWIDRILDALVAAFPRPDFENPDYSERLIRTGQAILPWSVEQEVFDSRAAFLLDQVGSCLYSQGRYDEGEDFYEQALAINRAVFSENHIRTALSINNLAMLYKSSNKWESAEPLFLQAVALYRKLLPEKHPDMAISLNNLAALYEMQQRLREAESLYREALIVRRGALPERHPDIALSLNNLAALYRSVNRRNEAEPLFREAAGIMIVAMGRDHPETRSILNNWYILQSELQNDRQLPQVGDQ